MKTSEFDYALPPELIAQEPLAERSGSRMMVVHRSSGTLEHKHVFDLPEYLVAGDLLVVNDTKVFPARILGVRSDTGGKIELLLVEEVESGAKGTGSDGKHVSTWDCFLRAGSRPIPGMRFLMANGRIKAQIVDMRGDGRVTVMLFSDFPLMEVLKNNGYAPVPPYIHRSADTEFRTDMDRKRYQTIYAAKTGAVAAPTAGLHFSEELFQVLEDMCVCRTAITLHVGPGTFKPVSAEVVKDHVMESERYVVTEDAERAVSMAKNNGRRVVAVGSTSVRTLETVHMDHGWICACSGRTSAFIYPPYEFKAVDIMLTNFHLPKSTLIMMVCAFGGMDLIMAAYREAIANEYRFYSYGDCMLVL